MLARLRLDSIVPLDCSEIGIVSAPGYMMLTLDSVDRGSPCPQFT